VKRRGLGLALIVSIGVSSAFAASLAAVSSSLGAATVTVPRCTTAGLSFIPNLSGSNVASVTVGSIPASCGSATIALAVNNGSASSTGSATIAAAGGSVTVTLAAGVPATTAIEIDAVISGP
jgi:hypothetical protein